MTDLSLGKWQILANPVSRYSWIQCAVWCFFLISETFPKLIKLSQFQQFWPFTSIGYSFVDMLQRTRLERVKMCEDHLLEAHVAPVRNYLLKHVMPTLSQGLLQCFQIQPQDPVDFLVSVSHLLIPADLELSSPIFISFIVISGWVPVNEQPLQLLKRVSGTQGGPTLGQEK